MDYIKQKLALVPNKPGCYQMKNKDGIIIYVGKAKKLKNRLSSYFRGTHTGKTKKLVSEISDFEYIVVENETESLVLELNLIKKYDPKYNILLRDDKSYPYIELTNEEIPKLSVVRNVNRKRSNRTRLFGPYPNVTAARTIVNLLNRIYPLRKCNTYNKKPCLYYHIGQCLGYCSKTYDKEELKNMESEILSFLRGNDKILTDKIKIAMNDASNKLNFEKAKEYKEMLDYINILNEKQKVEINDTKDIDVFGYYLDKSYLSIQVFFIRGGKILERHSKIYPIIDDVTDELNRYIAKFYEKDIIPPKEILVPSIVDPSIIEKVTNIKVVVPSKGTKKNLVDMACNNASIRLNEKFELIKKDEQRTTIANEELKNILKLDKLDRIEIFDNAHLFGTYNVSGMVVYVDGKESKNDYRKYKISVDKNDDYNTMREVIYRRYFRVLNDNLTKPDLILVDGGKGQINAATDIISSLGLNIPVAGLKKDDKHATNALIYNNQIIEINKRSNLFYYLERMQDEVHNFTINYHKQLRSKGSLESILESVSGIGEVRKIELLKKYKTITKLKEVDIEELKKILPENVAKNLKEFLENY
ncbi:MAG: excinuclease ABC subunit UvrC [Tenericutes bacterium]|nr:excinuclease ABC subunit UvrC [Mycoplasmatota bacterium]MDY3801743.1 excinuclease ABC subunit UvrC [Bacilli bacterium]